MAIPHASPGQVIDIRPLGSRLSESITTTLIKTDRLEVIRLVVPAGKEIPPHKVDGEITVQCLEGRIEFNTPQGPKQLEAGEMLFLEGSQEHSVKGVADATVLVTILL
jgi:quercetin dioxygenase-like cupin family protein